MDKTARIQNSIKFIEDNLCKEIKLSDIAKVSYFSDFHFHRLFKNVTGKPVMEYVKIRRLLKAADALVTTEEKITDIAYRFQFSSEESFSRAFKMAYSMSPRKFRNKYYKSNAYIKNKVSSHVKNSRNICCIAA